MSLRRTASVFFATTFLSFAMARAQAYPSGTVIPLPATPSAITQADLNRDGHPDLILEDNANGGTIRILLGNGDGTFHTSQSILLSNAPGSGITIGDLNGDGIPDIVLRHTNATTFNYEILAYLGVGDGTFQAPIASTAMTHFSQWYTAPRAAMADFDGDGLPDIIYGDDNDSIFLAKGDGHGHFTAFTRFGDSNVFGEGTYYGVDLNGDGRPDLICENGSSGSGFQVYLNQGGGVFTTYTQYQGSGPIALHDMNGDGHLDVVTVLNPSGVVGVDYGAADGTFAPTVKLATISSTVSFVNAVADLAGDGKPRVVLTGTDGVTVALGATPGVYQVYAGAFPLNAVSFSNLALNAVADYNGDGFADIAMMGDQSLVILFGKADGTFAAAASVSAPIFDGVTSLVMVDVTGDHIPDAVISTGAVMSGNGDGTFTKLPGYNTFAIEGLLYSADFDGDGKNDIFTYGTMYYGLGNGTFGSQALIFNSPTAIFPTGYYAIGDFNNDGKPDLAASMLSNSSTTNALAFATSAPGTRNFTYTSVSAPEGEGPMAGGDLDGDHCADIAVGGQTKILIFKSDCKGNFSQIASYLTGYAGSQFNAPFQPSSIPTDLILTDLDGDGNLDIVYTISLASIARVLYGNGNGTFTQGADIALVHPSNFVTAGDLDNDGYPDLVFSGHSLVTVLHGQPGRTFSAPQYLAAGYETGKAALADLRRHGRLDIAVPNLGTEGNLTNQQGYSYAVFLNPLPAISATSLNVRLTVAPEPSIAGQTFTATASFVPAANPAIPTGTATFTLDGQNPVNGTLDSSGVAKATFTSSVLGNHTVAVSYPGDSNFNSTSASVIHVVAGIPTTTALSCTPSTSYAAQTTLFNASVSSASGTPTGGIILYESGIVVETYLPLAGGAIIPFGLGLAAGAHTFTAVYQPAGSFATSSTTCTVVVSLQPTASVLTVSPTSATIGSPVTLTADIAPTVTTGSVSGTVTFYAGSLTLGTATILARTTSLTVTKLPAGTNNLTCSYSGDTVYAPSVCNVVPITITASPTALSITSSANPSPALAPLSFTARLSINGQPAGAGNPITFTVGSTVLGTTSTDATGTATISTSSLSAPGVYTVTANSAASANLGGSTAALSETITSNATTTTLAATPSSAHQGQAVTLTANVSAPNPNLLGGTVTFYDGATALGTANLAAGNASLTTSTLAIGTHTLTASFAPSTTVYLPSTSPAVQVTILASAFTLQLSPSAITLPPGQSGTVAVQLASIGSFAGPLTLTHGAMPTYGSATISPATVTLAPGGTASATLSLTTLVHAAAETPTRPGTRSIAPVFAAGLLLLLPLAANRRIRRHLAGRLLLALLALATIQGLTGCTTIFYAISRVSPGSYQLPVTATDANGNSQTATLTIVVTP